MKTIGKYAIGLIGLGLYLSGVVGMSVGIPMLVIYFMH